MNITFNELRNIKHKLPHGSVKQIADSLSIDEQTVRNYFGAHKLDGGIVDQHIQQGPEGGIVHLEDTTILNMALDIIKSHESGASAN